MADIVEDGAEGAPVDRRGFIGWLALALAGAVSLVGAGVAAVFSVAPALRQSGAGGSGGAVGADSCPVLENSPSGALAEPRLENVTVTSSSGWSISSATQAVYLDVDASGAPRAFSARCPHEGCHVDWRASEKQYVCPCHDSRWTREGDRVAGPTKRGLDPLRVERAGDGSLQVCYKTFALDTPDRVEVG